MNLYEFTFWVLFTDESLSWKIIFQRAQATQVSYLKSYENISASSLLEAYHGIPYLANFYHIPIDLISKYPLYRKVDSLAYLVF